MRCVVLLTIVLSLVIMGISTSVEMANTGTNDPSFRSVYKEGTSMLFFLDRNSSFYHFYSFTEDPPYLTPRKMGHFFAYGFLAAIIFLIIPIDRLWLRGVLASSSSSLIGFVDEVHQHFLLNRSGRILDVYINTVGSLISVLLLVVLCLLLKLVNKLITRIFIKNNDEQKKTA